MNNKIRINRNKVTDEHVVIQLQKHTPEALWIAKKVLVTASKYLKGGGIFSSKKKKGDQLEKKIYMLENALREHKFKYIKMSMEGPVNVLFEYLSLVSDAYPNWQYEYELLNDFIPNCPKYK